MISRARSPRALDFVLGPLHSGALAPEHLVDLRKSGLTGSTITLHRIRSVPPDLIGRLLGFDPAGVVSAMLLPFPNPMGGWFDHIRMKMFPTLTDAAGHTIKYLGPRGMAPRLYFPIPTTPAVLAGAEALWLTEGCKKALAVAQLGIPVVGFEGIEAWHAKATQDLLTDFDLIPLSGRVMELVPDGDVAINPSVRRGVERLAAALAARGARPRLVTLPSELAA